MLNKNGIRTTKALYNSKTMFKGGYNLYNNYNTFYMYLRTTIRVVENIHTYTIILLLP